MAIKTRLIGSYGLKIETIVNIKYNTITKKVKLVVIQLPSNSKIILKRLKNSLH